MATRPGTTDLRASLLREALEVMETDYAQQLEVDDVARRILTSRRQLQRVFTEVHGSTFRTTLRSIRMARAQDLLRTDMPIADIARKVGYTQPAQFAKAFRRTFGQSPTEFRTGQAASGNDGAF
jgi:AraC family transcriptional regulator, regulatory protein of adaptative response / methylphosphotriester-DNA alkyltransferase methyltransferase